MPIYEYVCKDCNTEFEELVSSTSATVACPKCGSSNTEKLMSASARVDTNESGFDALQPAGGGCSSGG